MFILFPGRHQLLTTHQHEYLKSILDKKQELKDIDGKVVTTRDITAIIFAVTSANHSNTRRNPLAFYIRALAIQEFARDLDVPTYIFGIDDIGQARNFSSYTIKRIHHESESMFDLTPENTLVLCSTPVLEMYEEAGFRILPGELTDRKTWKHRSALPWDVVGNIASNEQWREDADVLKSMHPSSVSIWEKYRLGEKVRLLFRDKMISDDGDITTTRDYNTYVRQMDEIAGLKYSETATHIRPGRIGDIGCAVGSWMKLACDDIRFRESDFYGIEVARHLFDICQQRKHNGEFKNPFVFFSQRNAVTGLVFDKASMNTIHTSSLTHEIESYGSREELLQFIQNRYDELASGGVWVNRDVVGPENRDEVVLMKLNDTDGRNDDYEKSFATRDDLAAYLTGLSTYGRFLRFVRDFRKKEGYTMTFTVVKYGNISFIRLPLKDGCEFISRKDYVDNWESEMHETFCFWDFNDWTEHLASTGFRVLPESAAYTNTWLAKNRFEGKAEFFKETKDGPEPMRYPVTNMLMIAEKR